MSCMDCEYGGGGGGASFRIPGSLFNGWAKKPPALKSGSSQAGRGVGRALWSPCSTI